ncbi:MAG: site-specific integrase [Firmicutes bacterium]|nr:site-specific integrase [Bacillota bacterium]
MKRGLNIYKRKDGRWEGRYIKSHEDNKIKYGYIYTKSYTETREKLMSIQNISVGDTGNITTIKDITFNDMANEWLTTAKISVKQSTYTKYYYTVTNHIKNSIGDNLINMLTSVNISNYTNELIQSGKLSSKTIKDILCVIGMIIKYYKRNYNSNININITYPRCEKPEIEVLTDTEIKSMESQYIKDNTDIKKLGVLLTLYTGLRLGEVCALKWENISLKDGYIKINKTIQRVKNFESIDGSKTKLIEESPKSKTSARKIPLPDFLLLMLKNHYIATQGIYFLTGTSNYIEPRTYQNYFKRYLKDCGVKTTNFHVLRHTFATRCINNGCDVKALSEILGHTNINITLERYVHSSFEQKRININKVLPLAINA